MIGFIIWSLVSCFFIGLGISCLFAKKATGFWSNIERPEVTDIKKYNRAMCKLWCAFGVIMMLLGLPLLGRQNSPLVIISVLGMMFEAIAFMVFYVLVIEKKYIKKD